MARSPNLVKNTLRIAIVSTIVSSSLSSLYPQNVWAVDPQPNSSKSDSPSSATLSRADFINSIENSIPKVEEFAFIVEEAKRLNIKVFLADNSASTFGQFIRRKLLEAKAPGHDRFEFNYNEIGKEVSGLERFKFNYLDMGNEVPNPPKDKISFTEIFMDSTGIQLVVDGPFEQIADLSSALQRRYPFMKGPNGSWQIRSLRGDSNSKGLLSNPDFLNQSLDSRATGLIELTPTQPYLRVRDLKTWWNFSDESGYLNDLMAGTIHFNLSELGENDRQWQYKNPPIYNVINYYVKVSTDNLEVATEDKSKLATIVSNFHPTVLDYKQGLKIWLEEMAPKIVERSRNIVETRDRLKESGLLEVLSTVGSQNPEGALAQTYNELLPKLISQRLEQLERFSFDYCRSTLKK